jgi:hypothetical protein
LRDDERAEGSVDVERGVFFIFHTYKIAQIIQNARDFFTIVWIIFVDRKKFCRLARFLNSVLRKCLIIKDLRRAAGRARVSRWKTTAYMESSKINVSQASTAAKPTNAPSVK